MIIWTFTLLLGILVSEVEGTGKLLVKFISFGNPGGKGDNGQCCDGKWIFCEQRGCDHTFTVCVDMFYGSSSMNSCPLGSITTGTMNNQDYNDFGDSIGGTRNPMTFSFVRWRLGAKLKVEIVDNDDGINSHDYVDTVSTRFARTPARNAETATWRRLTLSDRTTLVVEVKEYCDPDWFGKDCSVYCVPSMNGGHYDCNPLTGAKICHQGWQGYDCDVQVNECASSPCQNGASCDDALNSYTCSCLDGYQGAHCETDVDECAGAPCRHGATCVNSPGSFTCNCRNGFTGDLCEVDIDECARGPCENDGTCVDREGDYECTCLGGYTGHNCQTEIRECDSSPCLNNGTCSDMVNEYNCTCLLGFTGTNCQTNIDECESSPCFGEFSQCIDMVDGYVCACPRGLTGSHCETDTDECASGPCLNNGSCVDLLGQFSCLCEAGWTGSVCESDVDECASSPCPADQTCVDDIDHFRCVCLPGWTGSACGEDIDECLTQPCGEYGECSNTPGNYSCACVPGWTGNHCDVKMDPCWSQPCANNGSCISGANDTVSCNCTRDWTGDHCQLFVDDCSVTPCENSGSCDDEGALCHCPDGWFGTHCQHKSQCQTVMCQNRGVCEDSVAGPSCVCPPGYTSRLCESPHGDCLLYPCYNNGTCVSGIVCQCAEGFSGHYCEDVVFDPCASSPCLNGATCIFESSGNYSCACLESFSGPTCSLLDHVTPVPSGLSDFRGKYPESSGINLIGLLVQAYNRSLHRASATGTSTVNSTDIPLTSSDSHTTSTPPVQHAATTVLTEPVQSAVSTVLTEPVQSAVSTVLTELTEHIQSAVPTVLPKLTETSETTSSPTDTLIPDSQTPNSSPFSFNVLSANDTRGEGPALRAAEVTTLGPEEPLSRTSTDFPLTDDRTTDDTPDKELFESSTLVQSLLVTKETEVNTSVDYMSEANTSVDNITAANTSVDYMRAANTSVDYMTTVKTSVDLMTPANTSDDYITTANTPVDYLTPANTDVEYITPANTSVDYMTPANTSVDYMTPANTSVDYMTPANMSVDYMTPANISVDYMTPANTSVDSTTPAVIFEESGSGSLDGEEKPENITSSAFPIMNGYNVTWQGIQDSKELTLSTEVFTTIVHPKSTYDGETTREEGETTPSATPFDPHTTSRDDNDSGDGSESGFGADFTVRETPLTFTVRVTHRERTRPPKTTPGMSTDFKPTPSISSDFSFEEGTEITDETPDNNEHDIPPKYAKEVAFVLSGSLKEGDLTLIEHNLRALMSEHLKTKPRNIDIVTEVSECTSAKGNPMTVLLVTVFDGGDLVYSDVITEAFRPLSDEEFQDNFPLPANEGEDCLPPEMASHEKGSNGIAMYIVIGMFAFLLAIAAVIIFIAVRRRRSGKMFVSRLQRKSDDPLQRLTPLYRHYRESGIVLPPSPAGQTITVNPTYSSANQPLHYESYFAATENNYEDPLMAPENHYEEVMVPRTQNDLKPEDACCSKPPGGERPKLKLDLTNCNLEWIDNRSNQNLYEVTHNNR